MELLLFDMFTILLIIIDMYNYGKQVTPFTIFGGVYVCLINLNNLIISKVYSFYSVNTYSLRMIFLFFVVIFIIDFMGGYLYRKTIHCSYSCSTRFVSYRSVTTLFLIGCVAYSLQFVLLYKQYGLSIKGLNGGLLGHLSFLAYIFGPVVLEFSIKKNKKAHIIFVMLLNIMVLSISVAFGGKYVIFINLSYFFLYFILKRDKKVNFMKLARMIVPLVIVVISVFIILYYVIPQVTGQYKPAIDFAIEHMLYYLLGSVVANNYTLSHAGQGNALIPFTVIINIGKALIGNNNYVNSIYPFIFQVNNTINVNVSGFLGEVVYDLGVIGAVLYNVIIFGVINYFYYQYRSKNRFYLSCCYSTAITVFLSFSNFFTVSGVVLPLLLAVFIDLFSLCKLGNYHI